MGTEEFIDINLDAVDDGFDPMPSKLYLTKIKSAEHRHKEGSEYPYINVVLQPLEVEEKFQNRNLFLTLSYHPKALWNMKLFTKMFGIPQSANGKSGFYIKPDADGKKMYPDFEGKEGWVTVGIEKSNQDPDRQVNTVSNPYHPASKKF